MSDMKYDNQETKEFSEQLRNKVIEDFGKYNSIKLKMFSFKCCSAT